MIRNVVKAWPRHTTSRPSKMSKLFFSVAAKLDMSAITYWLFLLSIWKASYSLGEPTKIKVIEQLMVGKITC
jgi:hypothetical protein